MKKVLFICIMVIMVMALVLPACAPAKPATPPAPPPPPPPPADAKYTNTDYGFVITYPGTWKSTPSAVPTTVFFAQGPGGAFDDFVQVNVRPGDDFKKAAIDWATEQVTAKKIDAKPALIAEKDVKMGGMDGKQVTLEVDAIIMKLGSVYYGFVKNGKVVMINVAGVIKPNVDKYAIWQKILDGITWSGAAAPTTPAAPVAPAAPAVKTSFEAATYTNESPAFSISYPKEWAPGKVSLSGGVFYAAKDDHLIYVGVRSGSSFKDTAIQFITDLIALGGTPIVPGIDSEATVTGLDGKTQLNEILVSAAFGLKKGAIYGYAKDGKVVIAVVGLNPGKMDLYKEIGKSLSVK